MKKLLAAIILSALAFTACSSQKDAKVNTPAQNDGVTVSLGYSLDQFGLKVSSQNAIASKQESYSDEININGNYTELFSRNGSETVPLAALQGFYKKDLKNGEVFINGHTFTADELADKIVYEDNQLIVYDISYYVYPTSLEERTAHLPNGVFLAGSISQLSDSIEQKNPGKELPEKVEKANSPSKTIKIDL